MNINREKLPYRKAAYGFLLDNTGKKVMCKNSKTFMTFPGGGIDPGETIERAVRREILEETGAILNKDLKFIMDVKRDYHKDWAGNIPKKIKRYKQFRGEHIYIFVGSIEKFTKPTSNEGDEWTGKPSTWFLPIKKVIKLTQEQELLQPLEDRAFRTCQKSILSTLLYTKYKP